MGIKQAVTDAFPPVKISGIEVRKRSLPGVSGGAEKRQAAG